MTKDTNILSGLRPSDFTFVFESKGTPFLFEDLVCEYYASPGVLSLYTEGSAFSYILNSALDVMEREEETRSSEHVRACIHTLASDIVATPPKIQAILDGHLDVAHLKQVFALFGSLFEQYSYFGHGHWDKAFEKARHDSVAKENVRLVQNFKNEIRAKLDPLIFEDDSLFVLMVQKVSSQVGVPIETLNWYRQTELLALLGGRQLPEAEIESRKAAFIFYKDGAGITHFYSGQDLQKQIQSFIRSSLKEAQETVIVGRTAHATGTNIRGRVRVIKRDYADSGDLQRIMSEMQQGEVLVSPATDPQLMPAFKKAAAVITDVGGMLSHAPITARELNIPCIVGTESASKVLNTGDLVEVDTEKGVVRIIEKA